MGAVLCIITKSVTYGRTGCVHAKEACSGCNPAVNNQDCQFYRSTLLLNLNCADNVTYIKFNAVLEYKQAGCLDSGGDGVITSQRQQTFVFALFDNFFK